MFSLSHISTVKNKWFRRGNQKSLWQPCVPPASLSGRNKRKQLSHPRPEWLTYLNKQFLTRGLVFMPNKMLVIDAANLGGLCTKVLRGHSSNYPKNSSSLYFARLAWFLLAKAPRPCGPPYRISRMCLYVPGILLWILENLYICCHLDDLQLICKLMAKWITHLSAPRYFYL